MLKCIREKDTHLKLFRRLTTSVNNIKMSTPTIRKQHDELKRTLDSTIADEKYHKKRLSELRKEIDIALFDYLKMEKVEKNETEQVRATLARNQELEETLDDLSSKANESYRQVEDLKMEKDLKAREVIRIQSKLKTIRDEKGVKDIAILDASKRVIEAQTRVRDSATMYELVKNERNKYLNQIQSTTQKAAEMKEKIRILTNEIEILRYEIVNREKEYGRKRQETTSAYANRDTFKNEANKFMSLYKTRRGKYKIKSKSILI